MRIAPYTADQIDALQEIANVAIGQAGACLATMLDVYVSLSVPHSRIISVDELAGEVAALVGRGPGATAVRQAFFSEFRGEAVVLFDEAGCACLADLLGHEGALDQRVEQELLLDVSNLLVGAVIKGLAEQLRTDFSFSPPAIMPTHRPLTELLQPEQLGWQQALLIEVHFSLEERGFRCHLILVMPEESIELMRGILDAILAEL